MDGCVCWWADFRSSSGLPEGWITDETGTEFHAAVMDWMRSLGLDPNRILPAVGVCPWQGQYELHVDEVVSAGPGRDRSDPLDQNRVLTRRRIVHVEVDTWPVRPVKVAA